MFGSKVCPLQTIQLLWKPIRRSVQTEELDLAEEREIVLRCQNGDADAMGTLVIRYQHWVYNIAYGMLSHHQDAQDVAQDAFLSAWENIGKFQFRSRFSTCSTGLSKTSASIRWISISVGKPIQWRLTIHNRGFRLIQQHLKRQPSAPKRKKLSMPPLAKLKDSHREILVLRELRDMAYEEIAEILGCTLGRVKSRLHEARKALKKELERVEW